MHISVIPFFRHTVYSILIVHYKDKLNINKKQHSNVQETVCKCISDTDKILISLLGLCTKIAYFATVTINSNNCTGICTHVEIID